MKRLLPLSIVLLLFAAILYADVRSIRQAPIASDGRWINPGSEAVVHRNVVADTTLADCDEVDFRYHRQVCIRVVSGAITSITPYIEGEPQEGQISPIIYELMYDKTDTQIGPFTVRASGWTVFDEDMFPAGAIKFVPNVDGTIDVLLKG